MELSDLQTTIRATYGTQDRARGTDGSFAWFVEEVGELSRAIRRQGRAEQIEEFTDVLAWLVSLADQCGIDLDAAMAERYGSGCPRCGRSPCRCGQMDPTRP